MVYCIITTIEWRFRMSDVQFNQFISILEDLTTGFPWEDFLLQSVQQLLVV